MSTDCFELKNLEFSYSRKSPIIKIKELKIQRGEKVFIHGPSGSGKSTLLNLLAGVLIPDSGLIRVLEQDFSTLNASKRDKFRGDHIGFIFQSFNLINYLNISENISLPCLSSKIRKGRLTDTLESEILEISKYLKLDDLLLKNVGQLSIGQQQRVAVARALIGSPEIIIADEPTSSLDDEVTDQFMKLLLERQKQINSTLIFVSHDKRLEKHFEKVISLSEVNDA